ncbi:unnamed protein product [Heligmosomoides polygyrus]|uniref:Uncharacterized protein n=1 Tax=Heligmosomoides polygyrus TaxID=6339 RepID=A0A183FP18_HELPZ|nr:unnamed protein product [Heligmosomoides polygyrus]
MIKVRGFRRPLRRWRGSCDSSQLSSVGDSEPKPKSTNTSAAGALGSASLTALASASQVQGGFMDQFRDTFARLPMDRPN